MLFSTARKRHAAMLQYDGKKILLVDDQDWSSYVTTINKQSSFSRKKIKQKKGNGFITLLVNPSYQSIGFAIKWGNLFINSIRNFPFCLKMFIMQSRERRELQTKSSTNWHLALAATPSYNACSYSQLCKFDDSKLQGVKKLMVWFCYPGYLVYFRKSSICDALSQFN